MEFWFSEFHTPDVKHSIRVNKQLYSKQSDYQRIDIFETPEFGRATSLQSVGVFRTDEVLTAVDPSLYAGAAAYVQVRLYGESLSSTELSSVSLNRVSLYTYEPLSGPTDGSQYSGIRAGSRGRMESRS